MDGADFGSIFNNTLWYYNLEKKTKKDIKEAQYGVFTKVELIITDNKNGT